MQLRVSTSLALATGLCSLAVPSSSWAFAPETSWHHGGKLSSLTNIAHSPNFSPRPDSTFHPQVSQPSRAVRRSLITSVHFSNSEQALAFWIFSFAASHIGMSAVRSRLIRGCGTLAYSAGLVGRGVRLPGFWPGDDVGKLELFPDEDTTGRQLYRAGYTAVSFTTLGLAFSAYLSATQGIEPVAMSAEQHGLLFAIASAANGISIASLVNASPLSLVPDFTQHASSGTETSLPGGLTRNDALKLEPRGLTRITRHPLILPVVPWGLTTSALAGGRAADYLLFTGLALYAIAGCAAQDLRVQRREGSVGTVFRPLSSETGDSLSAFFAATSFVPFGAVLDGRQAAGDVWRELPLAGLACGVVLGAMVQHTFLSWLVAAH